MLKEKEKIIINELRKNSREKIKKISKITNTPISSTFIRLKRLETFIKKYTSILNFKNLSFPLHIIFIIKTKNETKKQIENIISKSNNINNIYRTSNGFSYLIDCYFKNLEEIYTFENNINFLCAKKLIKHEIIREIKYESFLIY